MTFDCHRGKPNVFIVFYIFFPSFFPNNCFKLQVFKNLFQLKGGILQYLEKIQKNKSKWKGECFVFDNRVSVKNELSIGTYELCFGCRMPISIEDRISEKYEKGVSCIQCFNLLSNEKKARLRERNKQIKIAKKKGIYNPYIKYTPLNFL